MDDQTIIQLLQENPQNGIHEAIEQYGSLVNTIIGRILHGHNADIEECTADVFNSLCKNR